MLSFLRNTLLLHGAIDHSLLRFCVSPGTFHFLALPLGTQIPEFHGLGYDMLLMGCAFYKPELRFIVISCFSVICLAYQNSG